jgi:uncharacterized flavoprotein (TIGR03862 family)
MISAPSGPGPVAVLGAGPAGLMAAEALARAGIPVEVFDAMPTAGRKFLLAGRGGLNLTHSEALAPFLSRYRERHPQLVHAIEAFGPQALRSWARDLGIETFVGSSGRVFPNEMKAAPLLRAWLHRLRTQGVRFRMRHRWTGWVDAARPPGATLPALRFETPDGSAIAHPRAIVLALGGASWARLGSDGAWTGVLQQRGVPVAALRPANCGFDVGPLADRTQAGWSAHFIERFAGQPLKTVAARPGEAPAAEKEEQGAPDGWRTGDFVITDTGIEGTLVYALSADLRDAIEANGQANLLVDLAPGRSIERLRGDLARPRGGRSLVNHLRARAGLDAIRTGLLREVLGPQALGEIATDAARLAAAIKALPLPLARPRPIDEAISTAGGVRFEALDENLMIRALPGLFCAGEMLDWEAPTGGYLLTACFATGRMAGLGAASFVQAGA